MVLIMDGISNYSNYSYGSLQVVPGFEESFLYQENQAPTVPQAEPRVREQNLHRGPQILQFQETNRETFSLEEDDQRLETTNRYAVPVQEVPQAGEMIAGEVLKENFQDLQNRFSCQEGLDVCIAEVFRFCLSDEEAIDIRIKVPGLDENLPIFIKNITDSIDIAATLPEALHREGFVSILHLLKRSFPKLTQNLKDEMPRCVFSCPIPLNHEDRGMFFPQIELRKELAYVAWDSSGIVRGFKKKAFDVVLKSGEAFSALPQRDLFRAPKVTMIGILIINSLSVGSNSRDHEESVDLNVFFGDEDLPDRELRQEEQAFPFCIEIVHLGSSEQNPVPKKDLITVIDIQFQEKAFADLSKS